MTGVLTDRLIANRYRLGDEIGAGGSARVYAATDERLGRPVAVKLLDAGLAAAADPAGRERFLLEARTAASFVHHNAVLVFDSGEDDDQLYMVMELVEGQTLASRLASVDGPLPLDEAAAITDQVLAALEVAHDHGIVHRDIKPANVLVGSDGGVKLADFGIAKRFDDLDASITTTGLVIGTPRYLAPEQVMGKAVGPATDLYATGILLFEMLTGDFPFQADTPAAAAFAHHTHPVPDLGERRPDLGGSLARVLTRVMAKEPVDRYTSAAEFRVALAQACDESTDASPTTTVAIPATAVLPVASSDAFLHPDGGDLAGSDGPPTRAMPAPRGGRTTRHGRARRSERPHRSTDHLPWLHLAVVAAVVLLVGVAGSMLFGGGEVPDPAQLAAEDEPVGPGEIIPGFAATDDLWGFLEQLEADPMRVGAAGDRLLDGLRAVLGADSPEAQQGAAALLRSGLGVWVDDGHLHPAIATYLDGLLLPVAEQPLTAEVSVADEPSSGPAPGRGNGRGNRDGRDDD